ncbi:hypothetical protein SNEBB_003906 [Seison nebaliae]|nr:hypothetical protein SNEBB_003906 [Seison nebaliae]
MNMVRETVPILKHRDIHDNNESAILTNQKEGDGTERLGSIRRITFSGDIVNLGFSLKEFTSKSLQTPYIIVSFISHESAAEKSNLRIGDRIIRLNGRNVTQCNLQELVEEIQTVQNDANANNWNLEFDVMSTSAAHLYRWIDRYGKEISAPDDMRYRSSSTTITHPTSKDYDVIIKKKQYQTIGLTIRGGLEYGLGIYITSVYPDGAAAEAGLKIGDMILEVNGISFLNILHSTAVQILSSNSILPLKIKRVNKLPTETVNIIPKYLGEILEPAKRPTTNEPQIQDESYLTESRKRNNFHRSIDMSRKSENEGSKYSKSLPRISFKHSPNENDVRNNRRKVTKKNSFKKSMTESSFNRVSSNNHHYMHQWRQFNPEILEELRNEVHRVMKMDEIVQLNDLLNNFAVHKMSLEDFADRLPRILNNGNKVNIYTIIADLLCPEERQKFQELTNKHQNLLITSLNRSISHSEDMIHGRTKSSIQPGFNHSKKTSKSTNYLSNESDNSPVSDRNSRNTSKSMNNLFEVNSLTEKRREGEDTPYNMIDEGKCLYHHHHHHDHHYLPFYCHISSCNHCKKLINMPLLKSSNSKCPLTDMNCDYFKNHYKPKCVNDSFNRKIEERIKKFHEKLNYGKSGPVNCLKNKDGMNALKSLIKDLENLQNSIVIDKTDTNKSTDKNFSEKPKLYKMTVNKIVPTLGLIIEGGADSQDVRLPRVVSVLPNGSAALTSDLQAGHTIHSVNGTELEGYEHRDASYIIAEAFKNPAVKKLVFIVSES